MYSHHFSINNIPFGIASSSSHAHKSVATRLEDTVIFLDELARQYPELSKETITTFSNVNKILCIPSSWPWLISSGNTQPLRRSP
jgi:fumarylacetoacetase